MSDIEDNTKELKADECLPEEKKTTKRLLDVEDEDNDSDVTLDDPDAPPSTAQTTTPILSSSSSLLPTANNNTTSSTTTTAAGHSHAHTHNNSSNSHHPLEPPPPKISTPSPKSFSTSPIFSGQQVHPSTYAHHDESSDSEHTYFNGRRIICESGSSDISGSEDNSSISRPMKKKKKSMRREGKIYDLLEQRLGSEALRSTISNPNFTFDWPYELVLVRHGQSEGNEAQSRSKRGDLSAYTPEFKKKHSSTYRLTDKGIQQAKIAGKWVRENIAQVFDRYYTSEYVRAMETASLLGLEESKWLTEIQLRERDKGKMDNISWTEKNEKFGHEMELRKRDSFFWAPPGGESIANICTRVEHTFTTLRRECANKRVVIVCHGEIMWAFRVRLERLSQIRFHQLQSSKDPRDQIHNTSILWYTRVHPKTGEIFPYFKFLRSVCPWRPEYSAPGWLEFDRPVYTNEELMESVRTVPRYVNNFDKDDGPNSHPEPPKA
ncbi:phosphoglycerate mutase domain-containing protein [Heterostelium album PN500]|uniref:phosphoglycerate mutase (2,3-diphosphoglycerate-dependent) n=1 Tax=Heterostelium pallidum (strain ATCC 26659 / Pp 5 / PN500) TaxID=670386 RepID=D3AWJ7_HETP5|nr:phosphoglycerate mutase domain-containing protein [Heterostelium album PN500]EFA86670.1 phosphoglycerate mutase domain-containing protein [Heterostelium album PN500]|eukprot:XP_020438774.1 phosphoglycerate mutase domain-containing protein [Heterostelium album PN500]